MGHLGAGSGGKLQTKFYLVRDSGYNIMLVLHTCWWGFYLVLVKIYAETHTTKL